MSEKIRLLERGMTDYFSRKGGSLNCISGKLWVTCSEESRDFLLTGGQTLDLRGRKGVCVQALEAAEFSFGTATISGTLPDAALKPYAPLRRNPPSGQTA